MCLHLTKLNCRRRHNAGLSRGRPSCDQAKHKVGPNITTSSYITRDPAKRKTQWRVTSVLSLLPDKQSFSESRTPGPSTIWQKTWRVDHIPPSDQLLFQPLERCDHALSVSSHVFPPANFACAGTAKGCDVVCVRETERLSEPLTPTLISLSLTLFLSLSLTLSNSKLSGGERERWVVVWDGHVLGPFCFWANSFEVWEWSLSL